MNNVEIFRVMYFWLGKRCTSFIPAEYDIILANPALITTPFCGCIGKSITDLFDLRSDNAEIEVFSIEKMKDTDSLG